MKSLIKHCYKVKLNKSLSAYDIAKKYNINSNTDKLIKIKKHIEIRFNQLDKLLSNDKSKKVIIAGKSKVKYGNITKNNYKFINDVTHYGSFGHRLGTGLAIGQWGDRESWFSMIKYINSKVEYLMNKFGPSVIKVGFVGAKQNPSNKLIHIWGANATNWNLKPGEKIQGGGQAAHMGIQKPGIFGIITTPSGGTDIENLFAPDKTIHI